MPMDLICINKARERKNKLFYMLDLSAEVFER